MEPYKAEDMVFDIIKMNGETKTCNNCLHHGAKKGRRCYDCTYEGDDLPKWERLSYDACLQMVPKENDHEQQIKSCKTCQFPGPVDVGVSAEECHDCCQGSNWQPKDPLPRSGSGNQNQGGASSEDKHICDALLVEEGDRLASPSQTLLEYARELKNEAKLHNIKVEQMIKKIDEFMEGER